MGYITVYGHHAGDPRYILILDYSAFVLTSRDAVRAKQKVTPFQVPGAMSERERELAHKAWISRQLGIHVASSEQEKQERETVPRLHEALSVGGSIGTV